jgi:hypothetical protein
MFDFCEYELPKFGGISERGGGRGATAGSGGGRGGSGGRRGRRGRVGSGRRGGERGGQQFFKRRGFEGVVQ